MLENLFSIRQFWQTKWSFLVHSTTCTRNAPYIHGSRIVTDFPRINKKGEYVHVSIELIALYDNPCTGENQICMQSRQYT